MVRLSNSRVFAANVDHEHARMLADIEKFYKELYSTDRDVSNTELFRWMVKILWIQVMFRRDEFEKLCKHLIKNKLI